MSVIVSVPDQRLADDVGTIDGAEIIVWPMQSPAPRARIDLVVPPYMSRWQGLRYLDGVQTQVVQAQSIGYDGVAEKLPPGHVFANAATVHETSTAELAVGLILAAQRGIDRFAVDARREPGHRWSPIFAPSLADRRVLLLGFGGVGRAIAARLAPFEVQLTAVASRARREDGVQVHGPEQLASLLSHTDILIVALPGGDDTRHVISDPELAALPDGALVVNVGRGPLIDTDALVRHVRAGRLRAALDVTDPEPLPEDHPLWGLDGVLISPHVGGASTAMHPRIAALVRRQTMHLLAGEPPENVVLRS